MNDVLEKEWLSLVRELETAMHEENHAELNRLRVKIRKFINEQVLGVKK